MSRVIWVNFQLFFFFVFFCFFFTEPIYGAQTGFGQFADKTVEQDEME